MMVSVQLIDATSERTSPTNATLRERLAAKVESWPLLHIAQAQLVRACGVGLAAAAVLAVLLLGVLNLPLEMQRINPGGPGARYAWVAAAGALISLAVLASAQSFSWATEGYSPLTRRLDTYTSTARLTARLRTLRLIATCALASFGLLNSIIFTVIVCS